MTAIALWGREKGAFSLWFVPSRNGAMVWQAANNRTNIKKVVILSRLQDSMAFWLCNSRLVACRQSIQGHCWAQARQHRCRKSWGYFVASESGGVGNGLDSSDIGCRRGDWRPGWRYRPPSLPLRPVHRVGSNRAVVDCFFPGRRDNQRNLWPTEVERPVRIEAEARRSVNE